MGLGTKSERCGTWDLGENESEDKRLFPSFLSQHHHLRPNAFSYSPCSNFQLRRSCYDVPNSGCTCALKTANHRSVSNQDGESPPIQRLPRSVSRLALWDIVTVDNFRTNANLDSGNKLQRQSIHTAQSIEISTSPQQKAKYSCDASERSDSKMAFKVQYKQYNSPATSP